MADYDLKANITADTSGFEAGIKKAQKASKNLSSTVSGVINGLGKNGLVGALGAVGLASSGLTATLGTVIKVARQVSQAIGECTEAYKKQIIAERQLETSIKNNPFVSGESLNSLKQFASEMQKVSNYGDEELIPMMANLVSLGRTEDETMKIMAVALDMSASGSMSLDTAINQLNATLNGNIGRLGQQNAELKGLTEEELRQGKAVEILGEKFKGLSSATVDTSKQLKNLKGDFKEAIGEFTLPSSDMWNKFWSGFYERGIEVIGKINAYMDAQTIGKKLSNAITEQLKNFDTGDIGGRIDYIRETLKVVTDEELIALKNYLENLNHISDNQKQVLKRIQTEVDARKEAVAQEKKQAEEAAKRKKATDETASKEQIIIDLKQKYIDKISEQETKWRNIETVTGEMVSKEEKLKYYQEQLVAIMTESGGQITQNNQYYKDQMAIINKLKEALGEVAEINAEIGEELAIKNAFEEIGEGISSAIKSIKTDWKKFGSDIVKIGTNSFGSMFEQLGEDLANGEAGFENFANSAVKSIAEILKSLAAQLSALAAVNLATWQFGKAAIAAGAAAAALVAAGALSAVANNMNAINQATANANISLEQFDSILQNIKETSFKSPSTLTKGFVESSKTLKKISESYKKARDEYNYWYEKLRAFNEEIADTYWNPWQVWEKEDIVDSLNAARDVYDLWASEITKVNRQVVDSFNEIVHQMEDVITNNSLTVESYKDYYFSFKKYQEAWRNWVFLSGNERTKIKNDLNAMYQGLIRGDITENLYFQYQKYSDYVNMVRQELKAQVQELEISVYESFSSIGKNLGETLFNAIYDGISKESFMGNVKSYIRKMMLQITVYTESFSNTLSNIGTDLIQALFYGGTSSTALQRVKAKLSNYYDEVSAQVQGVEELLDSVFGKDLEKSVNEGINSLTRFEQALQSILDTISDLGGDIASQLVDGLSNGLSQSDFLNNMRQWVRNMMIQMVVYTDAMKGEIEAIGKRISEGVMTGFTDTDLHEIRRDLSYIFEEAASKVTNIDSLLGSVFGYANGTNNASSGLRLVGEAGPELVKFRGGEQVLNTRNTQKALANASGTTINQNVTFNNLQDTTAFAMMNQFKQYNRQLAINGII